MKDERLMALVDSLLHHGRQTAEALAARFEVTPRTIYRDIDALCAAGVPIVAEAGIGGGYEIAADYRIDRSYLSKEEIRDLSGLLRAWPEAVKDRNLERSLSKIAALGPRGDDGLPPPLIARLAPWNALGPAARTVGRLRSAIAGKREVEFAYRDGAGRFSRRRVEPFSVVIGGAVWYLHAWCLLRGAFRLFKLSRIDELTETGRVFDPFGRLPVPDPFAFSDSREIPVEIVLSAPVRFGSLLEELFPGVALDAIDADALHARFWYPLGPALLQQLLTCGPGIRVLSPDGLRRELAAAADTIAADNAD
jgi:predicted DNA-binding transcriptional regulator YafY